MITAGARSCSDDNNSFDVALLLSCDCCARKCEVEDSWLDMVGGIWVSKRRSAESLSSGNKVD